MIIRAIRSELLKFFTTRLWWGMAIACFFTAAAFSAAVSTQVPAQTSSSPPMDGATASQMVNTIYTSGMSISKILVLSIGVMCIGQEIRHKTITGTFLATPQRWLVIVAKILSLLVIGSFYALLSLVGAILPGAALIAAKGHNIWPSSEVTRTVALSLLVLGLWGLIGFGIAVLLRNQVAALVVAPIFFMLVEPIATLALKTQGWGQKIIPYLPGRATDAVLGAGPDKTLNLPLMSWWGGSLTLLAYALAFAIIGTLIVSRRDVT